jgi:cell division protein FtsZ
MAINISVPEGADTPHLKPRITVVGVGGAGGNAVNNMIDASLEGVDFVVANTDAQALCHSRTSRRIQLGTEATQGLGAGARPEVGRIAAEEAVEAVANELNGANMVFITAGMGGGTGTGAAPVVASVAREMGILTVGVVTKPFQFEGHHRMRLAEAGIDELAQFVDTLIIIPNQNLFRVANEKTTFADAFKLADDVLYSGVRSVTDLMINPGLINLDFADVRTVMQGMGRAMMGTGEAEGDRRALDAAEAAIANPLLEDTSMRGARGVLINITGGTDVTLYEVDEAANRIRDEVETDAHIIFGSSLDPSLDGRIRVSVVATGISAEDMARGVPDQRVQQTRAQATQTVTPDIRTPDIRTPAVAETKAPAPRAAAPVQTAPLPVAPRHQAPAAGQVAPAPRAAQSARPAAPRAQDKGHRPLMDSNKSERVRQAVSGLENMLLENGPRKPPQAAAAQAPARGAAYPGVGQGMGHQGMPSHGAASHGSAPMTPRDAFIPEPPMGSPTQVSAAQGSLGIAEPVQVPVQSRMDMAPAMDHAAQTAPAYDPRPARDFHPAPPRAPQPQQVHAEPEKAERPSLLARITGLGHRAAPEHRDGNPLLSAKTLSSSPEDRGMTNQADDQLEIPAFLRRQAN